MDDTPEALEVVGAVESVVEAVVVADVENGELVEMSDDEVGAAELVLGAAVVVGSEVVVAMLLDVGAADSVVEVALVADVDTAVSDEALAETESVDCEADPALELAPVLRLACLFGIIPRGGGVPAVTRVMRSKTARARSVSLMDCLMVTVPFLYE